MRTAREWLSGGGAIPKSSKTATKVTEKLSKSGTIKPFSKSANKVAKSIIEKSSVKKINPKLVGEEKLAGMRGFKTLDKHWT